MFARIGDRGLLALVVDDLQWGDPDSMRLLESLAVAPHVPRMLVLASTRSDEAGDWLASELASLAHLQPVRVQLAALGQQDGEALALSVLGEDTERTRRVLEALPPDVVAVHLSGLRSPEDVAAVAESRADAALIGEALMRLADPAPLLESMAAATRPAR